MNPLLCVSINSIFIDYSCLPRQKTRSDVVFRCSCVCAASPAGREDLASFSCLHSAVLCPLECMNKVCLTLNITPKLLFAEFGVCVCCMYLLVYVFVCVEARGRLWVSFFSLHFVFWNSLMILKLISSPRPGSQWVSGPACLCCSKQALQTCATVLGF